MATRHRRRLDEDASGGVYQGRVYPVVGQQAPSGARSRGLRRSVSQLHNVSRPDRPLYKVEGHQSLRRRMLSPQQVSTSLLNTSGAGGANTSNLVAGSGSGGGGATSLYSDEVFFDDDVLGVGGVAPPPRRSFWNATTGQQQNHNHTYNHPHNNNNASLNASASTPHMTWTPVKQQQSPHGLYHQPQPQPPQPLPVWATSPSAASAGGGGDVPGSDQVYAPSHASASPRAGSMSAGAAGGYSLLYPPSPTPSMLHTPRPAPPPTPPTVNQSVQVGGVDEGVGTADFTDAEGCTGLFRATPPSSIRGTAADREFARRSPEPPQVLVRGGKAKLYAATGTTPHSDIDVRGARDAGTTTDALSMADFEALRPVSPVRSVAAGVDVGVWARAPPPSVKITAQRSSPRSTAAAAAAAGGGGRFSPTPAPRSTRSASPGSTVDVSNATASPPAAAAAAAAAVPFDMGSALRRSKTRVADTCTRCGGAHNTLLCRKGRPRERVVRSAARDSKTAGRGAAGRRGQPLRSLDANNHDNHSGYRGVAGGVGGAVDDERYDLKHPHRALEGHPPPERVFYDGEGPGDMYGADDDYGAAHPDALGRPSVASMWSVSTATPQHQQQHARPRAHDPHLPQVSPSRPAAAGGVSPPVLSPERSRSSRSRSRSPPRGRSTRRVSPRRTCSAGRDPPAGAVVSPLTATPYTRASSSRLSDHIARTIDAFGTGGEGGHEDAGDDHPYPSPYLPATRYDGVDIGVSGISGVIATPIPLDPRPPTPLVSALDDLLGVPTTDGLLREEQEDAAAADAAYHHHRVHSPLSISTPPRSPWDGPISSGNGRTIPSRAGGSRVDLSRSRSPPRSAAATPRVRLYDDDASPMVAAAAGAALGNRTRTPLRALSYGRGGGGGVSTPTPKLPRTGGWADSDAPTDAEQQIDAIRSAWDTSLASLGLTPARSAPRVSPMESLPGNNMPYGSTPTRSRSKSSSLRWVEDEDEDGGMVNATSAAGSWRRTPPLSASASPSQHAGSSSPKQQQLRASPARTPLAGLPSPAPAPALRRSQRAWGRTLSPTSPTSPYGGGGTRGRISGGGAAASRSPWGYAHDASEHIHDAPTSSPYGGHRRVGSGVPASFGGVDVDADAVFAVGEGVGDASTTSAAATAAPPPPMHDATAGEDVYSEVTSHASTRATHTPQLMPQRVSALPRLRLPVARDYRDRSPRSRSRSPLRLMTHTETLRTTTARPHAPAVCEAATSPLLTSPRSRHSHDPRQLLRSPASAARRGHGHATPPSRGRSPERRGGRGSQSPGALRSATPPRGGRVRARVRGDDDDDACAHAGGDVGAYVVDVVEADRLQRDRAAALEEAAHARREADILAQESERVARELELSLLEERRVKEEAVRREAALERAAADARRDAELAVIAERREAEDVLRREAAAAAARLDREREAALDARRDADLLLRESEAAATRHERVSRELELSLIEERREKEDMLRRQAALEDAAAAARRDAEAAKEEARKARAAAANDDLRAKLCALQKEKDVAVAKQAALMREAATRAEQADALCREVQAAAREERAKLTRATRERQRSLEEEIERARAEKEAAVRMQGEVEAAARHRHEQVEREKSAERRRLEAALEQQRATLEREVEAAARAKAREIEREKAAEVDAERRRLEAALHEQRSAVQREAEARLIEEAERMRREVAAALQRQRDAEAEAQRVREALASQQAAAHAAQAAREELEHAAAMRARAVELRELERSIELKQAEHARAEAHAAEVEALRKERDAALAASSRSSVSTVRQVHELSPELASLSPPRSRRAWSPGRQSPVVSDGGAPPPPPPHASPLQVVREERLSMAADAGLRREAQLASMLKVEKHRNAIAAVVDDERERRDALAAVAGRAHVELCSAWMRLGEARTRVAVRSAEGIRYRKLRRHELEAREYVRRACIVSAWLDVWALYDFHWREISERGATRTREAATRRRLYTTAEASHRTMLIAAAHRGAQRLHVAFTDRVAAYHALGIEVKRLALDEAHARAEIDVVEAQERQDYHMIWKQVLQWKALQASAYVTRSTSKHDRSGGKRERQPKSGVGEKEKVAPAATPSPGRAAPPPPPQRSPGRPPPPPPGGTAAARPLPLTPSRAAPAPPGAVDAPSEASWCPSPSASTAAGVGGEGLDMDALDDDDDGCRALRHRDHSSSNNNNSRTPGDARTRGGIADEAEAQHAVTTPADAVPAFSVNLAGGEATVDASALSLAVSPIALEVSGISGVVDTEEEERGGGLNPHHHHHHHQLTSSRITALGTLTAGAPPAPLSTLASETETAGGGSRDGDAGGEEEDIRNRLAHLAAAVSDDIEVPDSDLDVVMLGGPSAGGAGAPPRSSVEHNITAMSTPRPPRLEEDAVLVELESARRLAEAEHALLADERTREREMVMETAVERGVARAHAPLTTPIRTARRVEWEAPSPDTEAALSSASVSPVRPRTAAPVEVTAVTLSPPRGGVDPRSHPRESRHRSPPRPSGAAGHRQLHTSVLETHERGGLVEAFDATLDGQRSKRGRGVAAANANASTTAAARSSMKRSSTAANTTAKRMPSWSGSTVAGGEASATASVRSQSQSAATQRGSGGGGLTWTPGSRPSRRSTPTPSVLEGGEEFLNHPGAGGGLTTHTATSVSPRPTAQRRAGVAAEDDTHSSMGGLVVRAIEVGVHAAASPTSLRATPQGGTGAVAYPTYLRPADSYASQFKQKPGRQRRVVCDTIAAEPPMELKHRAAAACGAAGASARRSRTAGAGAGPGDVPRGCYPTGIAPDDADSGDAAQQWLKRLTLSAQRATKAEQDLVKDAVREREAPNGAFKPTTDALLRELLASEGGGGGGKHAGQPPRRSAGASTLDGDMFALSDDDGDDIMNSIRAPHPDDELDGERGGGARTNPRHSRHTRSSGGSASKVRSPSRSPAATEPVSERSKRLSPKQARAAGLAVPSHAGPGTYVAKRGAGVSHRSAEFERDALPSPEREREQRERAAAKAAKEHDARSRTTRSPANRRRTASATTAPAAKRPASARSATGGGRRSTSAAAAAGAVGGAGGSPGQWQQRLAAFAAKV